MRTFAVEVIAIVALIGLTATFDTWASIESVLRQQYSGDRLARCGTSFAEYRLRANRADREAKNLQKIINKSGTRAFRGATLKRLEDLESEMRWLRGVNECMNPTTAQ